MRLRPLAVLPLLISAASANTEKAVFLGPAPGNIPSAHPALRHLHVDTLTPANASKRTHVAARFPSLASPDGTPTWLILDDLAEGQRYEVRVCWAATQPTTFKIATYELQTVLETPELLSQLSEYSRSRQPVREDGYPYGTGSAGDHRASISEKGASVLFLQILAAADYYTTNRTLMRDVPSVHVDIILDPFLLNALPRSLLPTAGYLIFVAMVSWFIAQYISTLICRVAVDPAHKKVD
ncbi:hypothetical protein GGS23DRAFT_496389 [Durotheca rogersii]|uniref:uncharacterized protein n=1 Tax=Durotheca rogersii TaxID=419775 RepID=UPI00221FB02C|nr:uncharacterized protein GGS23DRAFT_496389 [Durotheca rogersii]KAI5864366.1 hypothetical protein GGS23DRAFT_496389 [Durotheca rogersii]